MEVYFKKPQHHVANLAKKIYQLDSTDSISHVSIWSTELHLFTWRQEPIQNENYLRTPAYTLRRASIHCLMQVVFECRNWEGTIRYGARLHSKGRLTSYENANSWQIWKNHTKRVPFCSFCISMQINQVISQVLVQWGLLDMNCMMTWLNSHTIWKRVALLNQNQLTGKYFYTTICIISKGFLTQNLLQLPAWNELV